LAASSHRTTYAGQYTVNGTSVTFANANPGGEDFRAPWRHALDYLWYGNPSTSWDPTTHQVIAGSNTYERDAAIKLANYLNDPQAAGVYGCKTYGASPITYRGSPSIVAFQLNGSSYFDFHTNFLFGASAGAVVISQNFDLMGQWLRELLIEWGVEIAGDNYLTSVPLYFHCFFRVLGLLTLTGNHPNPANWNAQANMKIYKAVNKTYTYPGDTITYWINYRNLGSITATGVYIRDTLPAGFQYLASSPTAPSNPSSNVYEWGPFTVPGLQNQNYSATMSGITLIVRVGDNVSPGKYCITSDIRAANGTGWTTSDEANEITTICKTNCIDIVAPSLSITKTANPVIVNPYNTITYTINFCNSSTTWLEGGHNGIIFSAGVRSVPGASDTEIYLDFAGHHEAAEPVIDWNNYRISYFVNSSNHEGEWQLYINQIQPPGMTLNISSENYSACTPTPCYDPLSGKYYNKRIIIQPSSMPSAPTHHLYNYWGNMSRIHLGTATTPFYFEARLTANYNPQDWTDDWSQQTSDVIVSGPQVMMYPISPDWTDGDLATPGVVLNKVNKHACQTTLTKIENILIEEWDGYAWRKVFGNAPVANTKISNIVVFDSIPNHLNWGGFVSTTGSCSYNPGNRTIQCNINELKAGDCGQIQYFVVTQDPGCPTSDSILNNTAWITVNGLVSSVDNAQVTLVCNTVSSPTYTPYITPSYTSTFTYTSTQTPTPYYIFTDTPTPSPTNTETQTNLTPYITFTATITITFTQTETSVIILPTHTYTQTPSSKEESQIKTINIYPNPFDPRKHDMRIFLLCNNQYKTAYVKIYTKSGRLIREIIKNNDEIINNTIKIENINFKNLANGIYLIIITIKDETEKIVNSHIQTLIILRSK
ncbi:MAG: T9SS type A sorting domain-containing protein, partial [Candidatus Goldbacteria bacterium]|nr:T9SS type A sorting domain-containing protein [Candidatus Goldiibacteriota bacterium]